MKLILECDLGSNNDINCKQTWRGFESRFVTAWRKISAIGYIICQISSLFTCVLAAKDIPVYHVTVVQGDSAYMPCNISTSEERDVVVIILWYKEGLGTPVYTIDTRDRSIHQADRWSADKVFSNRAFFSSDKTPAGLRLYKVKESDAGIYRCRVDFRKAQTRNTKVNLTVIVPPHRIVILDEFDNEKSSIVGPYLEGNDLLLKCDVYGGKPKPIVQWWRENTEMGETVSSSSLQTRSVVNIKNLQRKDLRSKLTCKATNNNKTQPLTQTVYVDMNFPPLDVQILGSMDSLSEGTKYEFRCQSSGSRPPATLTWWINDKKLEKTIETISSDGNISTSTLFFVASKHDTGRFLICRSENSLTKGRKLESRLKLRVHFVPECKIELGKSLNRDAIKEGSDVYFDCLLNAEPSAYKVEWKHNGHQLYHNITRGIIISNQSLVLQSVGRSSAGNYSCVGFNAEGYNESAPFDLNVQYAPTCKSNQMRVHGIAKAEKASISCAVEANPSNVTFRWLFNNSAESNHVASSHITKTGTVSVVSYTPRTEMDYGTLLCWAKNSVGDQKVPCVFHIIAAGRPDSVSNCSVANISLTSFFIKCTEGFNGGLPQSFFLEVLKLATQGITINTTSPYPRFNVEHLEAGVQYYALVYAFNLKGRSEPIVVQASTLQLPRKQPSLEKSEKSIFQAIPLMTVAIVTGGVLFIIVMSIILILRFRRQRLTKKKNRKSDQEPNGLFANKINQNGDGDDKNPDVVPQSSIVEEKDGIHYIKKRQCISIIETTAPAHGFLAADCSEATFDPGEFHAQLVHSPQKETTYDNHSVIEDIFYLKRSCAATAENHRMRSYLFDPKTTSANVEYSSINAVRKKSISIPTDATPLIISKIESTV